MARPEDILSRADAEDFLYEEARLIDEGHFEEWLDVFTEDGIYWLPINLMPRLMNIFRSYLMINYAERSGFTGSAEPNFRPKPASQTST